MTSFLKGRRASFTTTATAMLVLSLASIVGMIVSGSNMANGQNETAGTANQTQMGKKPKNLFTTNYLIPDRLNMRQL
jgi:hypothetical protein